MTSRYEEIMKSKPYPPYNMGGALTEAMLAKAEKELGETEEVKARTIPKLRRMVQAEPGLVCPTDDAYLLQYLRARKFDVHRAFSLLKNFYRVKKSNEDLYGSFDRKALVRGFGQKAGFFLPYRDEEGCVVCIIKLRKWDSDLTNASEALICMTAATMIFMQEPASQVCGVRLLVDARGARLKEIRSFIPRHVHLLAKGFTSCTSIRLKGLHIYNESPIFQYLFSFLKLFLTEKLKNRIHMHGDSQKHLHKFIPKDILPTEDYGGDNTGDVAAWFNAEVEKHFEMYRQMTTHGYKQNDS